MFRSASCVALAWRCTKGPAQRNSVFAAASGARGVGGAKTGVNLRSLHKGFGKNNPSLLFFAQVKKGGPKVFRQ